MGKCASQCKIPALIRLMEDRFIEALQVRYDDAQERVKAPLFNRVEGYTVEII